jgi:hypothetical protein
MKKIIFPILAVLFITSCVKDKPVINSTNQLSATEIIKNKIASQESNPDFTVLISSVHPVALLEENNINNSTIAVQAYSREMNNIGTLDVNQNNIPFTDKTYFIQQDPPIINSDYLGKDVRVNIIGNNNFPNVDFKEYVTEISNFTLEGLLDQNKISFNTGVNMKWNVDPKNTNPCIIVIEGKNDNSEFVTKTVIVNENDGSYFITSSDLAQFVNFESIRLYFARGTDKIIETNGKEIEFTNINFSWARVYKN